MRVLIDECLDWRLARALPGQICSSVQQMRWSGITNGHLLKLMEQEGFDVFLTGDRNLAFQQNLPATRIAVVILVARSTRLIHTLPLMERVLSAFGNIQPGSAIRIG